MTLVRSLSLVLRWVCAGWILGFTLSVATAQGDDHSSAVQAARQDVQISSLEHRVQKLEEQPFARYEALVQQIQQSQERTFNILMVVSCGVAVNLLSGFPSILMGLLSLKKRERDDA